LLEHSGNFQLYYNLLDWGFEQEEMEAQCEVKIDGTA